MPKYKYIAFDERGKKLEGKIDANSSREVRKLLRRDGIVATKVIEPSILDIDLGELMIAKGLAKPFGLKEMVRFTKQLAILVNAGVPILEGLSILQKQEKNPSLKTSIRNIENDVGEGKTLHEAMSKQKGFDRLYCSLVKAGEASGILDTILNKLAEFLERREKLIKKVKSALTYPVIIVVVGITVVTGLMVFVVPKFVEMLEGSNQEIPGITQFVIDISDFIQEYFLLLAVGLIVFYVVFKNIISTPKGKKVWDALTMKSPVFGDLIIKGNLGGFTRTLATMLSAGVSIIEALDICIETIDNTKIANDLRNVREEVVKGKAITEPLERIEYFPPLISQMMKVGESSGNLDDMLLKVSDVFEEETNEAVDNMTALIEPIILVGLGGVVAVVLIAMYMPIFMSAGGAGG